MADAWPQGGGGTFRVLHSVGFVGGIEKRIGPCFGIATGNLKIMYGGVMWYLWASIGMQTLARGAASGPGLRDGGEIWIREL
ncbi:MAG: hypothetical protein B7Z37_12370 [Verrucomicrobia bacterium 12-59-8]|nr:MAG: hypothetical protein B7Z37_12370 [Verrucomicrobia bacterium 12-59-8]